MLATLSALAQTLFLLSGAFFLIALTILLWVRWLRGYAGVWIVATMPNRALATEVERRQRGGQPFDYQEINNLLAALAPPGFPQEQDEEDYDDGDDDDDDTGSDEEEGELPAMVVDTVQRHLPVAQSFEALNASLEDTLLKARAAAARGDHLVDQGPPKDIWHLLQARRRA